MSLIKTSLIKATLIKATLIKTSLSKTSPPSHVIMLFMRNSKGILWDNNTEVEVVGMVAAFSSWLMSTGSIIIYSLAHNTFATCLTTCGYNVLDGIYVQYSVTLCICIKEFGLLLENV